MKKPIGYDLVIKALRDMEKAKEHLIEQSVDSSLANLLSVKQEYQVRKANVKFAQNMLFDLLDENQIKAIVQEEIIETGYSWNTEKFQRNVLPEEIYCNSAEYAKSPKLQALMPKKVFR